MIFLQLIRGINSQKDNFFHNLCKNKKKINFFKKRISSNQLDRASNNIFEI